MNIRNIYVLIYDFDGVMTNNKVLVSSDGSESVFCSRSDGLAVSALKNAGIHQCIISTEANLVVKKRAEKLGIPCIHGVSNKKTVLHDYICVNRFDIKRVAYVGNDLNDLDAMKMVACKIVPRDAAQELLEVADLIIDVNGGDGVIYELYKKYFRDHNK